MHLGRRNKDFESTVNGRLGLLLNNVSRDVCMRDILCHVQAWAAKAGQSYLPLIWSSANQASFAYFEAGIIHEHGCEYAWHRNSRQAHIDTTSLAYIVLVLRLQGTCSSFDGKLHSCWNPDSPTTYTVYVKGLLDICCKGTNYEEVLGTLRTLSGFNRTSTSTLNPPKLQPLNLNT